MSKRMQVLFDEEEFEEIREAARLKRMTVAEWVRQALRAARRSEPTHRSKQKFVAVREAATHGYPTADIHQMLREIEAGYHTEQAN